MRLKIFTYLLLVSLPVFGDLERSFTSENDSILKSKKLDRNFVNNPHIPSKAKKRIKPYLLPLNHKMRSVLDGIFLKNRATMDAKAFHHAGFNTIDKGPRSFIRVARHSKMKGFLVKAYLDTTLEEKHHKPSWEWLVQRCQGAKKIRKVIRKEKIRHFVVAHKWIYCFPAKPSPPLDSKHTRHPALLVVTDMKLASKKMNEYAWSHYITEEHLDELYSIISQAKGSSYRPDNISYTRNGTFAFIDTEYPDRGPDFTRIRHYLNREMQAYWDRLVKNGGSEKL